MTCEPNLAHGMATLSDDTSRGLLQPLPSGFLFSDGTPLFLPKPPPTKIKTVPSVVVLVFFKSTI